jgi:hypothetical protein
MSKYHGAALFGWVIEKECDLDVTGLSLEIKFRADFPLIQSPFMQISFGLWSIFCPFNFTPEAKMIAKMRLWTIYYYISSVILSTEPESAGLQNVHVWRGKVKQSNFVQPIWWERLFTVYTPSVTWVVWMEMYPRIGETVVADKVVVFWENGIEVAGDDPAASYAEVWSEDGELMWSERRVDW